MAEDLASRLVNTLKQNPTFMSILKTAPELSVPDWFLGAGCVTQTVWNVLSGFPPYANIRDYDLVYFDDADLSYEAEDRVIKHGERLFAGIGGAVEIRNQARVHLWYEAHFGKPLKPYSSVEQAISGWPTIASSVGVRRTKEGGFHVFAPYGLEDIFEMRVRPNKKEITRDLYERFYSMKILRWLQCWPRLKVEPWDSAKGYA